MVSTGTDTDNGIGATLIITESVSCRKKFPPYIDGQQKITPLRWLNHRHTEKSTRPKLDKCAPIFDYWDQIIQYISAITMTRLPKDPLICLFSCTSPTTSASLSTGRHLLYPDPLDASLYFTSQGGPHACLDIFPQPITLHSFEGAEKASLSGKASELWTHQVLLILTGKP